MARPAKQLARLGIERNGLEAFKESCHSFLRLFADEAMAEQALFDRDERPIADEVLYFHCLQRKYHLGVDSIGLRPFGSVAEQVARLVDLRSPLM